MGNKQWYKLVFRQLQPIHIGYKKHGVVNETRIFITGQSMWGALTNAYGKSEKWKDEDYKNQENQEIFEKITCFYPMINNAPLYPRYEDGEFYLGDMSERKFRKHFTTTYISTSINPTYLNAKDESLHEIDVILPKDKENKKELFWTGYLEIEDKNKIPNEIYIGGDSRYGLGLMRLESAHPVENNFNYDVIKGKYQDKEKIESPLKNFLKFEQDIKFEGELKLLAEFDFYRKGSSPIITSSDFYINVGSNNITHNDNNSSSN